MKDVMMAAMVMALILVVVFAIVVGGVWLAKVCQFDHALYVAGRLYIRERGISAEVYTRQEEPLDGMSSLWNGGKVITKADMSAVQVGDMAQLYTVEGEHLVLECVDIRKGWAWSVEPQGDVIVINGRWVYRLTRL